MFENENDGPADNHAHDFLTPIYSFIVVPI